MLRMMGGNRPENRNSPRQTWFKLRAFLGCRQRLRLARRAGWGGRSSPWGRCGTRCGARAGVVAVSRLERDRRRPAERLERRDHAEDLLIGQADRRFVDGGHSRIEAFDDVGVRFVHRLSHVVDVAHSRNAGRCAHGDSVEIGEPERPALANRVAGAAESLAFHDLATDLGHVVGGHVASQDGLLRRLHLLLRHQLADPGIEGGRREDQCADPGWKGNGHECLVPPS